MSYRTALTTIEAYEEDQYYDIDLAGLIAFAVKWLLDRHMPTTFENITIAAFKMFPAKFALEGFRQYPDAARVNRSLLQLGPKYRNWARGKVTKGFVLTESGLKKVMAVENRLEKGEQKFPIDRSLAASQERTLNLGKELQEVENSVLYEKWLRGHLNDGAILEFLDMLGAYAYTPPRALRDRLKRLEQSAVQLGKDDVKEFLGAVRRVFGDNLKDN